MKTVIKENMNELETSNAEDMEMLEYAEYFDSLDAEDFEDMDAEEFAEYLEYLDDLEDLEHAQAAKRAKSTGKTMQKKKLRLHRRERPKKKRHMTTLRGRAKLAAVGGGGAYAAPGSVTSQAPAFGNSAYINELMMQSKGDLNVTIVRRTANIASPLPFILFGLNGFSSSYTSTIKEYLPAGVTMAASTEAGTGNVLLTFTAPGPLVDIVSIELTGSSISYSEFLQSMNSNYFKTRYIRQEYPNTNTLLTAVRQPINFGKLSSLGMKNRNPLLPRSRRQTGDFQTFIVNLFIPEQKVTTDFSFVQNIIAVADYEIAYDIFFSDRSNFNNMN